MQQVQQNNVKTWSCLHQMYFPANVTYEMTQERGYCVTRLRSVEFLESPPPTGLSNHKVRDNVIPFPQQPGSNPEDSAALHALFETWMQAGGLHNPRNIK